MAYSKAQLDKIGNLLVYVTSKLSVMSKTKLLKLVYIIEEEYMKQAGTTLTELSYTHLPLGPVSTFINKERGTLKPYITVEKTNAETWITPATSFNDDGFSKFDLQLIDQVLTQFGHYTANQLINYTHREGSLWKKIYDEYAGKPPAQTHIDMMQLLNHTNVSETLRDTAKKKHLLTTSPLNRDSTTVHL